MVDFEIKLQDNKVAEWSDHYIDYAALKKILKRAKISQSKYVDLKKRRLVESGKDTSSTNKNNGDWDGISVDTSLPTIYSQDDFVSVSTEETALMSRSQNAFDDMTGRRFFVKNALGNISGLLTDDIESRYARRLENGLKDLDDRIAVFDELFRAQEKKVKSFYYETLDDLEERLEFMTTSVARAFSIDINENTGETMTSPPTQRGSPFVAQHKGHRKAISMDDVMGVFLQAIVGDETGNSTHNYVREGTSRKHFKRKNFDRSQRNMIPRHSVSRIGNNNDAMSDKNITRHSHEEKSHVRSVTNLQLGHLLQDDDEEELHFQSIGSHGEMDASTISNMELEEKRAADAEMIKRFLISQYRIAKYLHNYAMLNITGFVKIAKKFDKTIPSHAGKFKCSLESRNMMDDACDVEALTKRYEAYYANWFCEGDVRAAKVQMLSKKGDDLETDWSQLQLGYRMGVCAVLAVWVCWDCVWGVVKSGKSTIAERSAFPIFRACGGLLLLQWFWGCSIFIWTRYRINYIFLFDFIPSTVSTPFDTFCAAVDNTLIFLTLMLLYYKAGVNDIPEVIPTEMYPLFLMFITLFRLAFPLRQRLPMWRSIYKVVSSPLHSPSFFQTYVGDILTSMVKIFQDIAWSISWLWAGEYMASKDSGVSTTQMWCNTYWYKSVVIPLITMMPLVIRFNQNLRKFWDTGERFPHLANASKYVLSSLLPLFGIFHPLYLEYDRGAEENRFFKTFWTLIFVTSSVYSFLWDVYMDWGLGRHKYSFLNQSLVFPRKWYYYATIGIDLVLRFLWVLTLVPPDSGASFDLPQYLTTLSMALELFRRTLWGFFRLEHEHRNHEHDYRRKGFVPLHFNTGHLHKYKDEKERAGSEVLREVILVTLIVGGFCFATIAAAQHANQRFGEL